MSQKEIQYEFINSETDNVIAYLSLPVTLDENERQTKLEKKRLELALTNGLYIELIHWRAQAND